MGRVTIFSPRQILIATLLGGPAAAAYTLSKNGFVMDTQSNAAVTSASGVITSVLSVLLFPFLATRLWSILLLVAFASGAYFVARQRFDPYYIRRFPGQIVYATKKEMMAVIAASLGATVVMGVAWTTILADILPH